MTNQPIDPNPPNVETADPPDGWVFRAVSKSQAEAVSRVSQARSKTIVKSAIQHYIRSWFDQLGTRRNLLQSIAPGMLQYVTDRSFDQESDITKRHMQVARWFDELQEKMPCILIVDGGATYTSSGLGDYDRSEAIGPGEYLIRTCLLLKVPLEIIIATLDQESTDELVSVMSLIFGAARRLGNGNTLHSADPTDSWEVRLPLNLSFSGVNQQNITEDTKDSIWTSNMSLEVDFEDVMTFTYSLDALGDKYLSISPGNAGSINGPITGYVDDPDLLQTLSPYINGPSTIRLNAPTTLHAGRLNKLMEFRINKPEIAIIDPDTLVITPKRLGTFTVSIGLPARLNQDPDRNIVGGLHILASQEITVTL
jgi:hypothetical protein